MTVLTVADCYIKNIRERPKYRLLDLLEESGAYRLSTDIPPDKLRSTRDPFQLVTVYALVWGGELLFKRVKGTISYVEEYKGKNFVFIWGKGVDHSDIVYTRRGKRLKWKLIDSLPSEPKPVFALDFSLIDEHLVSEARSLRKQVGASLGVIRRYLWDRHLILSSVKPGVYSWLKSFMATPHVQVSLLPTDEALRLRGYKKIILLDPSAEKPLTPSEVLEADAFIIGAIVDRLPRPGATRELELRGYYVPRRLELRGSIHGVPNRINMIIEILLKARYDFCGDIEKAILSTMSPHDARLRAMVELARWSRGRRRYVPCRLYYLLSSWLPLSFKDFVRAVRMAGLELKNEDKC